MVQRKPSNKLAGCPTDSTNGGGAGAGTVGGGGGDDLIKMLNKRRPNYMKPTRSSDARREVSQVTTIHSPTSMNAKPMNHAKPCSSSPLRTSINKAIMATCSSTLKNSKFPDALELQPGGTEAQGTSSMRVCPYSYCSLNGHWHEPLPPLKYFISAKRKLLNTQKSFKLKALPLFKVKGPMKDEEEIVDDFFLEISAKVEEFQDLQLQSLGERNTQNELNHTEAYHSDMHVGDLDEKSGLPIEENNFILSLLEYVEFNETIEVGEEVKEGRELTKQNLKDESREEVIFNDDNQEEGMNDEVIEEPTTHHYVHNPIADQSDERNKDRSQVSSSTKEYEESHHVKRSIHSHTKQDSPEIHGEPRTEDDNHYDTDDVYILTSYKSSEDEAKNTATTNTNQTLAEAADVPRAKIMITRKKTGEEAELMKEFNPRSPRFLEIESEPEAEIVDLKHQTTEGGKNPEEWMIDYALRRAISKLESTRNRKVALLVKAFETVTPLSSCEEQLSYGTPGFTHTRIIQPCS